MTVVIFLWGCGGAYENGYGDGVFEGLSVMVKKQQQVNFAGYGDGGGLGGLTGGKVRGDKK